MRGLIMKKLRLYTFIIIIILINLICFINSYCEDFNIEDRNYLSVDSHWYGNKSAVGLLQSNIYPQAVPIIKKAGSTNIMIWLADDAKRNSVNRTKLVYSLQAQPNGIWSEPVAIDDDGTADFYPDLASDGKNVYAVWQNINCTFEEKDASIEAFAKASEIMVARFNLTTNKFDVAVKLTANNILDKTPSVAVENGKAFVAWVTNDANDLFGINGKNSIFYAEFGGANWGNVKTLVDDAGNVMTLSTLIHEDTSYVSYCADIDGRFETMDDREIFCATVQNGTPMLTKQITQNFVLDSNPKLVFVNYSVTLFWYSESKIFYVDNIFNPQIHDFIGEQINGVYDNYQVVNDGINFSILWTKKEGNNMQLYAALYDTKMNELSNVVKLSNVNDNILFVSGIHDTDGELLVCYNRAQLVKTIDNGQEYYVNGQSDLCIKKVERERNISVIADSVNWNNRDFMPGNDMKISFKIKNTGSIPINKIKVQAFEGEPSSQGNSIGVFSDIDEYIKPGITKDWTLAFNPTQNRKYKFFYKLIIGDGQDIDESDNYVNVTTGLSDVAVDSVTIVGDSKTKTVDIQFSNHCVVPAKNITLNVTDGDTGALIYQKKYDELKFMVNKFEEFNFDVLKDVKFYEGDKSINVSLETDSEDSDSDNNYNTVILKNPFTEPPVKISVNNLQSDSNGKIMCSLNLKNNYFIEVNGILVSELNEKNSNKTIEKIQNDIDILDAESIKQEFSFNSDAAIKNTYYIKSYIIRNSKTNNIPDKFTLLSLETIVYFDSEDSLIVDSFSPTAPGNLKAEDIKTDSVKITWSASTDDTKVKGYEVYRDGVKIGSTEAVFYLDSNIESNKSYSYNVKSYDDFGHISDSSSKLDVTTQKIIDIGSGTQQANTHTNGIGGGSSGGGGFYPPNTSLHSDSITKNNNKQQQNNPDNMIIDQNTTVPNFKETENITSKNTKKKTNKKPKIMINEPNKIIPSAFDFKDMQNHWAAENVLALFKKGIINGYEDNTIRPDNNATRAEAITIIMKSINEKPSKKNTLEFSDSEKIPDWAIDFVKAAFERGIINGYEDKSFKPNQKITRSELIAMVVKAFEYEKILPLNNLDFTDSNEIPIWVKDSISKCVKLGIIKGYPDKTFCPIKNISRAELFTIIINCLNNVVRLNSK